MAVRACDEKLNVITKYVKHHEVLVKNHEDLIMGKNSKVEENFDANNGEGNYVMQLVQISSSCSTEK